MKRVFMAVVLMLALFVGPLCRATALDLRFLESVVVMTLPVPDAMGVGYLARGCTASSIGERQWVTAAHCVAGYTKLHYYILGDEVSVVKYDEETDLARLSTEIASRPALAVATGPLAAGDAVIVAGFPLGWKSVDVALGYVGSYQNYEWEPGMFWPLMMLNATGAPGFSGAPVLNEARELVAVVHIGFQRETFSPKLGATAAGVLKKFLTGE